VIKSRFPGAGWMIDSSRRKAVGFDRLTLGAADRVVARCFFPEDRVVAMLSDVVCAG